MNYLININKPILNIWTKEFIKEEGSVWVHPSQQHSQDFELTILEKGSLNLSLNGKPLILNEGEALLTPPFAHLMGTKPTYSAIYLYWTHFFAEYKNLKDNDSLSKQIISGKKQYILDNYAVIPDHFILHNPTQIYLLFNQLVNITAKKRKINRGNDLFLSYLLTAISNDYLENISKTEKEKNINIISEWIKVNISPHLTVKKVAQKFGLNSNYLSRAFKKETNIPLKSYIINMKLDYAKYLLSTTYLSVSEISYKSYFSDTKLFFHTFKKRVGITPSQYRNLTSSTKYNSNFVDQKMPLPSEFGTIATVSYTHLTLPTNREV